VNHRKSVQNSSRSCWERSSHQSSQRATAYSQEQETSVGNEEKQEEEEEDRKRQVRKKRGELSSSTVLELKLQSLSS